MRGWIKALAMLLLGLAWGCGSTDPAPADPDANTTAPVATFSHPQPVGFVWWSFPADEPLRALEFRFTLPADYPEGEGIRVTLAQGQLLDPRAVDPDPKYSLCFQSEIPQRGRGAVFTHWGTRDPANARAAAGGWLERGEGARGSVGVGNGFAWTAGTYLARLEWRRVDEVGTWYGLVFRHEASGDLYDAGELRFPGDATIQPVVGTSVELTAGVNVATKLQRWELLLDPPRANGKLPLAATTAYGELPNVDVILDPKNGRARVRFGGATPLRHASGSFDLSGLR